MDLTFNAYYLDVGKMRWDHIYLYQWYPSQNGLCRHKLVWRNHPSLYMQQITCISHVSLHLYIVTCFVIVFVCISIACLFCFVRTFLHTVTNIFVVCVCVGGGVDIFCHWYGNTLCWFSFPQNTYFLFLSMIKHYSALPFTIMNKLHSVYFSTFGAFW